MLRYKIIARNIIEFDIKNGYKIVAFSEWDNTTEKYYITLTIREKSVYNWRLIEEAERIPSGSNHHTIKKDMINYVNGLNKINFFQEYIDKYEYELKCFDIGNTFFENKGENNV